MVFLLTRVIKEALYYQMHIITVDWLCFLIILQFLYIAIALVLLFP